MHQFFKAVKSPQEGTGCRRFDQYATNTSKDSLAHPFLAQDSKTPVQDLPKGKPPVVRWRAEESTRVREQADRAHRDVLETLRKMAAIEDPGYHPLGRACSPSSKAPKASRRHYHNDAVFGVNNSTRLSFSGDSTVVGSPSLTISSSSTLASPDTAVQEDQHQEAQRETKASRADDDRRLARLRASLPPLNIGAPPVLPPPLPPPSSWLPSFYRGPSKLRGPAQANLYFTLELPNRGGYLHSPSAPLQLRLPFPPSPMSIGRLTSTKAAITTTENRRSNNNNGGDALARASAVAVLQSYFFHGVPIAFFRRFFPEDKFPCLIKTLDECREGKERGSLVWSMPQLFGPGYKYRELVEEVWEGGELGLRWSWVDAGEVGFAAGLVELLGGIAGRTALVEEEEVWAVPHVGSSDDSKGKGKGREGGEEEGRKDHVILDIAVVLRQYFPRGGGGYGLPMDIRRIRTEDVKLTTPTGGDSRGGAAGERAFFVSSKAC